MSFRVTNGGVTVSLDGQLEAFVRDLVARTQTVTIERLRAAADEVAATARAEWYGANGGQTTHRPVGRHHRDRDRGRIEG